MTTNVELRGNWTEEEAIQKAKEVLDNGVVELNKDKKRCMISTRDYFLIQSIITDNIGLIKKPSHKYRSEVLVSITSGEIYERAKTIIEVAEAI